VQDTVVPLVRAAMGKPVGLLVPMKVNIKVGPNWEDVTDRCASPS
jgi:DNA polymerase I-like protein with 3'-5' exonuclease and polymerase domains